MSDSFFNFKTLFGKHRKKKGSSPVKTEPRVSENESFDQAPKKRLFDPEYYCFVYPDAVAQTMSPAEHYQTQGWRKGYNPSEHFNTAFYLALYPAVREKGINPLDHYLAAGKSAGYQIFPDLNALQEIPESVASHLDDIDYFSAFKQGLFNPGFYLEQNSDVKQANANPLEHYKRRGWKEKRNPSSHFDVCWYTLRYLNSDFSRNALLHYIREGQAAGYAAIPPTEEDGCYTEACKQGVFDLKFYLEQNPDVKQASVNPFEHYKRRGWKERRNPSADFDVCWYVLRYLNGDFSHDVLLHYMREGRAAGYATIPPTEDDIFYTQAFKLGLFDPQFYLEQNPDAKRNTSNPLAHYKQRGWKGRGNPSRRFDICWYTLKYLDGDFSRDALLHYLKEGQAEGYTTTPITEEDIWYTEAFRQEVFDPEYYKFIYPEVAEKKISPFSHYIKTGWKEGRNPSEKFNTTFYLTHYPEVQRQKQNPLVHYIMGGRKTGYLPFPDDVDHGEHLPGYIVDHLADISYYEAFTLGLFDPDFYLEQNPDIKSKLFPFTHFKKYGWQEFRNPSRNFDLCWYTQQYLDGDFSQNAVLHYIREGRVSGNLTRPDDRVAFTPPLSYADRNSPPRRICLFAGYDTDDLIDDYVVEYVEELSRYADVYYLADSWMSASELEKLMPFVQGAWAIRQAAYDFGSWAMLAGKLVGWDVIETYDELLLVNDSCYLLRPLDHVFATMDKRACDWWGMQATKGLAATMATQRLHETVSLSEIKQHHLQQFENDVIYDFLVGSYFVVYRKNIILNQKFRRIFDNYRTQRSKYRLIRAYEVGLTRWLISCGYEFDTYVDNVYPCQPVFTDVIFSLIAEGFPFFKRYLLQENHYSIAGLAQWKEKLKAAGIEKDLERYEANLSRVVGDDKLYRSFNLDLPLSHEEVKQLDTETPKYDDWWAFPVCVFSNLLNDNIRALFEYVKDDPSIKKVVLTRKKAVHVSGNNVVVVPLFSSEGQYYLLRCRNIFVKHNAKSNITYQIASDLHNIYNLWHGIPLKRIAYVSLDFQHKLDQVANGNRMFKAVIAASDVDHLAMTVAHWPLTYDDIWVTGLPRHDFITNEHDALPGFLQEQSHRLKEQLAGRRLILFAPTFRNDQENGYYRFSVEEKQRLGIFLREHGLVMGIREHMADKKRQYSSQLTGDYFIDLSDRQYPDVESLFRHTALLITDYSSVFIDFLLTRRPVVSFAYDYESYANSERGLFYDMDWCFPGTIAKNFDALMLAMEQGLLEMSEADRKLYAFRSGIFLKYHDSDNRKRVCERVIANYSKDRTALQLSNQEWDQREKSVLWIYNHLNDTNTRYQLFNLAPEFEKLGWQCKVVSMDIVTVMDFSSAGVVVLVQVPVNSMIRDFCYEFKRAGRVVISTLDEAFFEEERDDIYTVPPTPPPDPSHLRDWQKLQIAAQMADKVIVPTPELCERAASKGFFPFVIPNSISTALIDKYGKMQKFKRKGKIRLCYLSDGSANDADFALCATALQRIVADRPDVEVHIVDNGAVNDGTGSQYEHYKGFIVHPAMSDEAIHDFLNTMDIHLAPLVSNKMNDAKIKIVEAALHKVPTIASPVRLYADVIRNGENGLLAASEAEWYNYINRLITDSDFLRTVGNTAFTDILPKFSAAAIAREYAETLNEMSKIPKRTESSTAP